MKLKNLKTLALVLSTSAFMTTVMAANLTGGDSGGGGDSLISKTNGELVSIADPLAQRELPFKKLSLDENVDRKLGGIQRMAGVFGFNIDRYYSLIHDKFVDYRLVDQLPNLEKCQERLKYKTDDQDGLEVEQSACTIGHITWIRKDHYEKLLAKDSKTELALLFLHEGLRRVPNLTNDDLVSITNGMRLALELLDNQRQGKLNSISPEQKETLRLMLESIYLNGLNTETTTDFSYNQGKRELANLYLNDYGGIISKGASVDPSAIIGIGARINPKNIIKNDVVIAGSFFNRNPYKDYQEHGKFYFEVKVGSNTKILNSLDFRTNEDQSDWRSSTVFNIGENVLIENSDISYLNNDWRETDHSKDLIPSNMTIKMSELKGSVILNSNVSIENSSIIFYYSLVEANASIKNSNAFIDFVTVKKGVSLKNLSDFSLETKHQSLLGGLLSGFRDERVVFASDIDLDSKKLCGEKNTFLNKDGRYLKIKKAEDLKRLCN